MLLPELKSTNVERLTTGDRVESDGEIKSTSARHISDKKLNSEADNFNKNLSVIAETSREYRSSSSASSGASTLALRSSKNLPHTPSDIRNSKQSLTTSHTILLKTKLQNYTGYEASSESSNIASKTPMEIKADLAITTFNLMEKLNAIESGSITENSNEVKRLQFILIILIIN